MGGTMLCRVRTRAAFAFATAMSMAGLTSKLTAASTLALSIIAFAVPAHAANLPQIKLSDSNEIPACVTPGRLTGFLENRNPNLDPKFETIAADYARIGDQLGIRWDIAFFQMLLETGNLTFTGDVSASQNNFAGLGAVGKRAPGESFPDVPTGVKAHLQHLLLYSGEHLADPVAERTRKVQEWGVLTAWQKKIKGPMTYTQLARQWAPGSRNYSRDIYNIAEAFMDGPCHDADPKPEMMALWKPEQAPKTGAATYDVAAKPAAADDQSYTPPKVSGYDLARRANEEARNSGSYIRSSLGAGMLAALDQRQPEPSAEALPPASVTPSVKVLNGEADAQEQPSRDEKRARIQTASLSPSIKNIATPPAKTKCKVWTASYGGSQAVIIKAAGSDQDNYTVLDVNEATSQRETDAYIAAYAKGGVKVGDFTSPTKALEKAFELCPEG